MRGGKKVLHSSVKHPYKLNILSGITIHMFFFPFKFSPSMQQSFINIHKLQYNFYFLNIYQTGNS